MEGAYDRKHPTSLNKAHRPMERWVQNRY